MPRQEGRKQVTLEQRSPLKCQPREISTCHETRGVTVGSAASTTLSPRRARNTHVPHEVELSIVVPAAEDERLARPRRPKRFGGALKAAVNKMSVAAGLKRSDPLKRLL